MGRKDYETPPDLFGVLHSEFHFTVDAASSHENALLKRHWTVDDNGLAQPWHGERVFCNPPFTDLYSWVAKASVALADVAVQILPPGTDTRWFRELVWPKSGEQCEAGQSTRWYRGWSYLKMQNRELYISQGRFSFYIDGVEDPNPMTGIFIVVWHSRFNDSA